MRESAGEVEGGGREKDKRKDRERERAWVTLLTIHQCWEV